MQRTILLVAMAIALSSCARYGNDSESYRQCVELAREEGQVIKYIDTTLQYRRTHHPGPDVEAEYQRADGERRDIHSQRRHLGCI